MDERASYPDLNGRAVLVTGGGSGIGRGVVEAFARQGARVAFLDIDPVAAADCAAATGATFEIIDLRDIAAATAAIRCLAAPAPFTVLINNAGDDTRHAWETVTPDFWDDRFAVNLRHQFFLAQAVAPGMAAAGGGAIVNLGSTAWMFGATGMIAYATAKAAIEGLTKSLARELGPSGIRVNAIAPGWVLTPRQVDRARATDPAKFDDFLRRQCIKEHLEPADIAALALWLASREARRCTGQTFIVDGGVV